MTPAPMMMTSSGFAIAYASLLKRVELRTKNEGLRTERGNAEQRTRTQNGEKMRAAGGGLQPTPYRRNAKHAIEKHPRRGYSRAVVRSVFVVFFIPFFILRSSSRS